MRKLNGEALGILLALVALAGMGLAQVRYQPHRISGLLLNTFWLSLGACAISLPLGTVLALLLGRTDLPGRKLGFGLLAAMLFVPLYLQGAAWMAGFGDLGWWTAAFGSRTWLRGWLAAVWVHGLAAVPWVALIVRGGAATVESELEEQTLMDASPAGVLCRVTLRRSLPAIAVAAAWVTIACASEISVTDLFQVRTFAEEIYTDAALGEGEGGMPALPILRTLAPWGAWLLVILSLCARYARAASRWAGQREVVFSLGSAKWPCLAIVVFALVLVVALPLGSLVWKAGVQVTQSGDGLQRHWSLFKCLATVGSSPWRYRNEFAWSLATAALAATLALGCAVAIAWQARRSGRWSDIILGAVVASALVPGPAIGLGLIGLLDRPGWPTVIWLYDRTLLAPCLAQAIRALPLATLIVWFAMRAIPRELLEMAAVEGAGPWTLVSRVAIPLCRPAIGAAWLIAFGICLGELAASILVAPPGVSLLSIRVFGLIHYGVEDQVAGICLAMVLGMALLTWLAGTCLSRQFRRNWAA